MNNTRFGTLRNPSGCSPLMSLGSLNKRRYAGASALAFRDIALGNIAYPPDGKHNCSKEK